MPTEEELVAHFGVSRTTVRQAMSDLANEGLVVRHAGRGTFARQPLMVVRMQQWHSLTTDIAQRGLRPSKTILRVEKLDARAEIAHRASELAEGDILHIQSVRYADGNPIVVLDNYFPFELCGFLTELELGDPDFSIERALSEHGIELARANGEISATAASKEEAKHLEIKPGFARGGDRHQELQRRGSGGRVLAGRDRHRALPAGAVQRLERQPAGDQAHRSQHRNEGSNR